MEFYFYPNNETDFKAQALNNFVHTIVFDKNSPTISNHFVRKVTKIWTQTVKNNIETDHRIKVLNKNNYQIYSWISKSEYDLSLPFFMDIKQ